MEEHEIKEINELRMKGLSLHEIGRLVKHDRYTIRRNLDPNIDEKRKQNLSEDIHKLREEGKTFWEIDDAYNKPHGWAQKHYSQELEQKIFDKECEEVNALRVEGLNIKEIARRVGRDPKYVMKRLNCGK